jgi:hypothetical protein
MRKINDGDGARDANLADLVREFEIDVDYLDRADIDRTEWELLTNQYAYIKFGLILEKVKKQCMWKRCTQKFRDFRAFCEQKISLTIWQVNNAIKSAQAASRLVFLGFTQLPKNASQAIKLADLSLERLCEVWGNVIKNTQGHKITADAIEREICPDKVAISETLRLPTHIANGLRQQAIDRGLTLNEYLAEIASGESVDEGIEVSSIEADRSSSIEINDAMTAIIDRVEYQWLKPAIGPQKFLDNAIDSFDRIMTGLLGQHPKPAARSSYE